ncbi:MAG: ABC transporter permease [Bacteroidetes bacterium]|nr:ABC transporter permease [Bacteroidota bacterium]MBU1720024.1 ABC transporter permease [Bacteroidota bacterium]
MHLLKKKKFDGEGSLSKASWRKLRSNRLSLISMLYILLIVVVAILGYLITPDKTSFSNRQILEISCKAPGFRVNLLKVKKNESEESGNLFSTMLFGRKSDAIYVPIESYRFENDKIFVKGYSPGAELPERDYSLADVLYALNDTIRAEFDGETIAFTCIDGTQHRAPPEELAKQAESEAISSQTFLLGTDPMGRDLLSRLIIGARVSISVGFISVAISLLIGILLGAMAGYFKGWVDNLIVWLINVIWSIPTLLLVIAITFALGKGFWQVFIAVGLTMWVEVARVVRGQIFSVREKEFVEAARALGFGHFRIIFRHILPNVMAPVIVISAANFASAILLEAGLSFLGIGVQPPMPSWGSMIKEHYGYLILDQAYLAIIPGIAIMLLVLSFMLLGNGLRDAMDVKS